MYKKQRQIILQQIVKRSSCFQSVSKNKSEQVCSVRTGVLCLQQSYVGTWQVLWFCVWRIKGKSLELFSAVLCITIVHIHKHMHMSSTYRCTRDCWFRFSSGFCVFFAYTGSICVVVSFFVCVFVGCIFSCLFNCQYQCKWLPGKTRLWNDLLCVDFSQHYNFRFQFVFNWTTFSGVNPCWVGFRMEDLPGIAAVIHFTGQVPFPSASKHWQNRWCGINWFQVKVLLQ